MTKKNVNPTEFIRTYQPITGTYAERGAKFLYDFMQAMPMRFVDKGVCAKISLGLSKIPAHDSPDAARFSSVRSGIKNKLRKLGHDIVTDRVDGLRCSVDADDLVKNCHRKQRRRVKLANDSLKATDALVDATKVKDPELKKELLTSRRSMRLLDDALSGLPQLTSGKDEKK